MPTGSFILFKADKGYGFIRPAAGGDNVYVHVSALQAAGIDAVKLGQRVTYDVQTENGKISAVNIKPLS